MNKLDGIVKQMIETHEGGEKFFDNLDEEIRRDIDIIDNIIYMIPQFKNQNIIVSGSFGRVFLDYLKLIHLYPNSIVWVNGGLRKANIIEVDLSWHCHKDFIFINDSYYSGKTKRKIENELSKYNSAIITTYVAYDGSYYKHDNVFSLYRYYE